MNSVMINLEALASGIGKQGVNPAVSFYHIAHNQLQTDEERQAFRLGALAMFADVGKMRLRRAYYTHQFRKAMKKLN
ncbi:hypothetical protein JOC94_004273 [Bacillus thermophilus]|uniref:Uncharacterized protein n=1 Tax=Siminovitchia thermophila TaxID=1245522 RepID=A0ABS2RC68_9BACI|nr:hypothetical protein [Siminovitchia thermophila]MBM7717248.1 hypothetical protein [Siminovitchia thermophila]ONK24355.1 hypothetical protein BLX87_05430 [Bacillus sp. VT-16-64]